MQDYSSYDATALAGLVRSGEVTPSELVEAAIGQVERLDGAINALGKVGLMMNVRRDELTAVLNVLPALKNPTISQLSDEGWVAVNTILEEATVRTIIPRLKDAGAQGIVEYPLNKIVM